MDYSDLGGVRASFRLRLLFLGGAVVWVWALLKFAWFVFRLPQRGRGRAGRVMRGCGMCKAQALRQPENGLSVGAPLCMRAAFVVFMPLRQPEKGENLFSSNENVCLLLKPCYIALRLCDAAFLLSCFDNPVFRMNKNE